MNKIIKFAKKPFIAYGIFWSWNFLFLVLLLTMEIHAQFLISIIQNTITGFTPLDFSLYSILIFTIPIVAVILAIKKLHRQPSQLLRLFYGVELPLWLLFILRISIFRELTPATSYLLFALTLGIVSLLVDILIFENKKPIWLKYAQRIGHSILALLGFYIGVVLIFYSIPMLIVLFSTLFEVGFINLLGIGILAIVFGVFIVYSWTLLILLPIVSSYLYIKTFIGSIRNKIPYGNVVLYGSLGVNTFLLFWLSLGQPQEFALELLHRDMTVKENKQAFLKNESAIKKGLLNGYLNSYRYISSNENNHIQYLYTETVGLNSETAKSLQNVYNFFMSPFLYNGSMNDDRLECKILYEKYFDRNIQKHETETIQSAMQATWDRDGIEAGLLNVNEKKVHIKRQEIKVEETDGVAEIELYEVYQNQTFDRQEIFYYFSLPANSAITGLWLSDNADFQKQYTYAVSPRGAAQKVYKAEVQKRVDPSLLEQVGPNQYRLRAFPIEPKTRNFGNYKRASMVYEVNEGGEFHLWLSYKTVSKSAEGWELPKLLEKRNVYWSKDTERLFNGTNVKVSDKWLPETVFANDTTTYAGAVWRISDATFKLNLRKQSYLILRVLKNLL